MSTYQTMNEDECIDDERTDEEMKFHLPGNAGNLVSWLSDQPQIVTVERTYSPPRIGDRKYNSPDKTVTEQKWIHSRYEEDTRACHDSQAEVRDAWDDGRFPSHNIDTVQGITGAHLYSRSSAGSNPWTRGRTRRGFGRRTSDDSSETTINFEAVQHPSGHGVIQHYSTIASIRTKSGLVLNNEQDYGTGFAYVTQSEEAEYTLPLDGVETVLDGHSETLYDITEVVRDRTLTRPDREWQDGEWVIVGQREARDQSRQATRVNLSTGGAVIIMYDSSANNRDERKCGYYLSPEEAALYDGAQGGLEALRPPDVKQAQNRGLEIVPSDEYAGSGTFYDDDKLGDAIIRQGEWYLIPMDENFTPDGVPTYKWRTGKWDAGRVDMPDDLQLVNYDNVTDDFTEGCPNCETPDGVTVDAEKPAFVCDSCGESTVYDRKTFEELAGKARREYITEKFGHRYDEVKERLDSHYPRDLAVTEDGIFVRGTFRHRRNEHKMLNVKERWHLLAENTRDVTVFDLGADTTGAARIE